MNCVCEVCGKTFKRKPSYVSKTKHLTCSKECSAELKSKLVEHELEIKLGHNLHDWLYEQYVINRLTTREISNLLYGVPTNSPNVTHYLNKYNIPMRHGSEAIKVQWENADERRKLASENAKTQLNSPENREKLKLVMQTPEYRDKSSKAKLGEKNPMWNFEMTLEERAELDAERKSSKAGTWKKQIFKRDNFTCRKCGKQGGTLNAHHILNFKDNPEKRYDVSNGVTLCNSCHIKFHQTYGYRNNTMEQLLEYMD